MKEGLRALAAVQAVLPGTILAGGYLRDTICGKPPKDIDLFAPYTASAQRLLVEAGMAATCFMPEMRYGGVYGLATVINVAGFELPVQVIVLEQGRDPVDDAKSHDFGICQVWHDGVDERTTYAFMRDALNWTFTLTHCEDEKEFKRSMKRWDRLKLKFPEYRLVVPLRFACFDPAATSVVPE